MDNFFRFCGVVTASTLNSERLYFEHVLYLVVIMV